MPTLSPPQTRLLRRGLALLAVLLLAGCAIAPPRTDDPLQKVNRKVYAFNDTLDKAVLRPVAVGYRKVTNPPVRRSVNNFFTNIQMPITVANDLLQARPSDALGNTGRFLINLTVGVGGIFDPATKMGLPLQTTDFGITLARWGVPEGDFLMLPLMGPSTLRDVWHYPVDGYFFDPLSIVARTHYFNYGQYYLPQVLYVVSMRSQLIDAEGFLQSAYDPYAFLRDAYRQRRLYMLYDGNPPADVIEKMQGVDQPGFDPDELLQQQKQWEQQHAATKSAPGRN
ncbi:MAG: ABC transporter [Rhodanobacter sp. 68-29]|uniref:MlaA family lipoprotein n=1 Tax=Rhodanobacter sp. PCA2 TaxID=2006117 RepID=UPI00086B68EE|nr:VacJ family lipoprotein [Rhodanobacter sp. PCA2]MBA2079554.1 ABC transporter [Rhodanobacter sp. PCA2]MBN8923038.1 VacJ family lipoprotein [Rhodanobacter sp.]ODU75343.1 MAG: ABC transporter [Rhodanobacter sp. SCN 69-32]OJY58567.1 MAG: ABC transporter [Rhodanobacter sp. 68-29]